MTSIGRSLLPGKLHERMQFDRYPINEFTRRVVFPLLGKGKVLLDAGSGRMEEQTLRNEILETGAALETLDIFAGEGVDYVGDVTHTEFKDNSYDVILCMQVLEHVEDPSAVCREMFRILKPGGHALFTAPQSAYLHNLPYHFFHFTNIGMRKMVEDAGFKVETMEAQGGHFMNLGIHLHYTCRVLGTFASSPLKKTLLWPAIILSRVLFGFIGKLFCLWLDKRLFFEGNTQGWNCLCYKPKF
jgi:SAM-dependent methyltransferase